MDPLPDAMPPDLLQHALAAKGFMPPAEGELLHRLALAQLPQGPALEVGTYGGKSAIYLGAAARAVREADSGEAVVFTVDHHRGSEENQAGWEHHDTELIDDSGRMDTLPFFRRALRDAGLEEEVIAVVGRSATVARFWRTPLSLLFIDGGHGEGPAREDYENWVPKVMPGGLLVIHDVFPDPSDGGRAPYEQIYLPAIRSGDFTEVETVGSMRALRRKRPGIWASAPG